MTAKKQSTYRRGLYDSYSMKTGLNEDSHRAMTAKNTELIGDSNCAIITREK